MEITIILIILVLIAVFVTMGYKRSLQSKRKKDPDQKP